MRSLRAFVGHSFSVEDEGVVGKILKYLDAISEINAEFVWEHAEHPEPSGIDEKVLRRFEDKNLFIGICTRKERVVQQAKLKNGLFRNASLSAKEEDFVWKTSDWVIQEIGLALGRGMKVILLVEEGVRSPGGIQGSLEYIPFEREAPERAFSKVLQMIASLTPRGLQDGANESTVAVESDSSTNTSFAEWMTPDHTWRRPRYEVAYMHWTAVGVSEAADKISTAFLQSSLATDHEKDSWAAFEEYVRIAFKGGGRIESLLELSRKHPSNSGVLKQLAFAYKALGEDAKAAEVFLSAASVEPDAKKRVELLGSAVDCAAEKHPALAESALSKAKETTLADASLNPAVLVIENCFSKARKEDGFAFAAMESYLEAAPGDYSKRFDLAYAYSEADMNDMALLHYKRIPEAERSDAAWNNIGVCFDAQKLPVLSVSAYKKARELGSTLAMSNLAYRLINAGFLSEARDICLEATSVSEHHKNADSALARVKEVEDAELESQGKMLSTALASSEFYREMGKALLAQSPADFESDWVYDGVLMRATLNMGVFSAHGVTEEKVVTLMRQVGDSKPDIFEVTISGVLRGRAMQGVYQKKRKASGLPSLLSFEEKIAVMMYFSDDGAIEVLHGRGDHQKRFKMLRKVADQDKALGVEQHA